MDKLCKKLVSENVDLKERMSALKKEMEGKAKNEDQNDEKTDKSDHVMINKMETANVKLEEEINIWKQKFQQLKDSTSKQLNLKDHQFQDLKFRYEGGLNSVKNININLLAIRKHLKFVICKLYDYNSYINRFILNWTEALRKFSPDLNRINISGVPTGSAGDKFVARLDGHLFVLTTSTYIVTKPKKMVIFRS